MPLSIATAAWFLVLVGLALFLGQIAAHEIGFRLGRRGAKQHAAQADSAGVVVGSMLGLLAFVLALTLSFASNGYNERRAGTLAEANAIGTAWLRARAIGLPRGNEIARLLEEYSQLRIAFIQSEDVPHELDALNQRTGALQTQIWGNVSAIVRERMDPVVVSLLTALNEAFDMTTATRFAFDYRLPSPLFWLLIILTLISSATLGYRFGLSDMPSHALATLLALMFAAVIVVIIDLASPRLGGLRTDTAAYEWTVQGFQGGVPIPPLPNPD